MKVCKRCGWQHPDTYSGAKCAACKTLFDIIYCPECKQEVPASKHCITYRRCKKCHGRRKQPGRIRYNAKRRRENVAARTIMYNEWLERIAQVPKDCPTLTEAQWLEACQHFNGCAWCGEPDIDARGFFIEFKYGGRYCNWNVIPVCAKCATKVRIQPNMFITEWYKAAGTPHLNAIVEYLGGKLDESIKSGTSN